MNGTQDLRPPPPKARLHIEAPAIGNEKAPIESKIFRLIWGRQWCTNGATHPWQGNCSDIPVGTEYTK